MYRYHVLEKRVCQGVQIQKRLNDECRPGTLPASVHQGTRHLDKYDALAEESDAETSATRE
jgi:hypothetical protein